MCIRVLFLSPHTDDVELGAGGMLCKLLESKDEIYWMVFSTAENSLPAHMPKDTLKKEFLSVISHIGLKADHVQIHDFQVRYLSEHRQEVLEAMIEMNKTFQPDLVVGPSLNDHHQDHQVVANEMVRAFKNTSSIISYELPWNHVSFDMQFFVKLDERHVTSKIKLLKYYQSQMDLNKQYFKDEFIKGMARTRGIQVNTEYAEAFEVIRWIL